VGYQHDWYSDRYFEELQDDWHRGDDRRRKGVPRRRPEGLMRGKKTTNCRPDGGDKSDVRVASDNNKEAKNDPHF